LYLTFHFQNCVHFRDRMHPSNLVIKHEEGSARPMPEVSSQFHAMVLALCSIFISLVFLEPM
jgi:hypothetical protein